MAEMHHHDEELIRGSLTAYQEKFPQAFIDEYLRLQKMWHGVNSGPVPVEILIPLVAKHELDVLAARTVVPETNGKEEPKPEFSDAQPLEAWKPGETRVQRMKDGVCQLGVYKGKAAHGKYKVTFQGDDKSYRHVDPEELRLVEA